MIRPQKPRIYTGRDLTIQTVQENCETSFHTSEQWLIDYEEV